MPLERTFRKSTFSGTEGGDCVEVANTLDAFRDTKNRKDSLEVGGVGFASFMRMVKQGKESC